MKPNPYPPIAFSIRRSHLAKNTRIVVKADKIEVVAPPGVSERNIKQFVEAQRDWIDNARQRVAEKAQDIPKLSPPHYADGVHIPYRGQNLQLRVKSGKTANIRIAAQNDGGLLIYLPDRLAEHEHSENIRQALTRWMKSRTREHAEQMIAKHAPRFALFPRGLRIKTQKSRWGSCGPKNDINLNWLLMLTPPEVFEYVVVHELCHIKHKNHSQDFWRLVAEHLPDYANQRRWLKQHGASVMRGL